MQKLNNTVNQNTGFRWFDCLMGDIILSVFGFDGHLDTISFYFFITNIKNENTKCTINNNWVKKKKRNNKNEAKQQTAASEMCRMGQRNL